MDKPNSYGIEPDAAQPGWWIIRIYVDRHMQVAWTKVPSWSEVLRDLADREAGAGQ